MLTLKLSLELAKLSALKAEFSLQIITDDRIVLVADLVTGVHTAKLETENHLRRRKRERLALLPTSDCECTEVQCTIQRVQPDQGHHCESKHNKRYDSTGLLSDK